MKHILPIILLSVSLPSSAQIRIINESLVDSSLNYLYIGIENKLRIITPINSNDFQLAITGTGADVYKSGNNDFRVRITTVGVCTISVKEKGKLLFSKEYSTNVISDPLVFISGLRDTTTSIIQLLINPFLFVRHPGCFFRPTLTITSFTCTPLTDEDHGSIATQGNQLSAEQIRVIKMLKKGDRIVFEDIRATCPDCSSIKLVPFFITIK